MRIYAKNIIYFLLLIIFQSTQATASLLKPQWLVMPHCLSAQMPAHFAVIATDKTLEIREVPLTHIDYVAKLAHTLHCGRFINITPQCHRDLHCAQHYLTLSPPPAIATPTHYMIRHDNDIRQIIKEVQPANLVSTIQFLSRYKNRSADRLSGVRTAAWLKEQFTKLADEAGRTDIQTYYIQTGDIYAQPSVVAILGTEQRTHPGIVLGAHMDTLAGRMPGADDDGSGTASVLEAARILMRAPALSRPIYFIWYAAEEQGLVGSHFVVDHFKNQDIPIEAVIQLDMTGFQYGSDPTLWFYKDNTSETLTLFMEKLTRHYLDLPVGESACGYACSDHANWAQAGFHTVFPSESDFEHHNPSIHTSGDTLALINLTHMTHFVQLTLAFILELGLTH